MYYTRRVLAKSVQMRAVSILIHIAECNKGKPKTVNKKVKAVATISSGGLALAPKHSLVMLAGGWHCSEGHHCHDSGKPRASGLSCWPNERILAPNSRTPLG